MKTPPPIYQWKKDCEIRIEEIKEELRQLESYPETPELRKQIEDLESELVSEYESLEDYKGRIQLYESELYEFTEQEIYNIVKTVADFLLDIL